jgi:hypothetical protein
MIGMVELHRVARAALLLACMAMGAGTHALAQGLPAPGATSGMAGRSVIPAPPPNLQLPGIDPRQCGTSKHAALCAEGRWARFAQINLDVRVGSFDGKYTIEHTGIGEVHGTSNERMGGKVQAGEAVIVSEDAFAFRSRRTAANADTMLDQIMTSPTVFSELVAILLEAALPEGPEGVAGTRALKAGSESQFILTQAPGGAVLYGPPWSVSGTVRRGAGDALAFDLAFRFRPVDESGRAAKSGTDTARLSGSARYVPPRDRLPDTFDLVGWKLVRSGTLLGDAKTLGEARQMAGAR